MYFGDDKRLMVENQEKKFFKFLLGNMGMA